MSQHVTTKVTLAAADLAAYIVALLDAQREAAGMILEEAETAYERAEADLSPEDGERIGEDAYQFMERHADACAEAVRVAQARYDACAAAMEAAEAAEALAVAPEVTIRVNLPVEVAA